MAKLLAPVFLNYFENSLPKTFLAIGIIMLVFYHYSQIFCRCQCRKNGRSFNEKVNALPEIFSKNFIFIWIMFTFAVIAGMIFISFQSPLLQDLLKAEGLTDQLTLEHKGATLIALSALFNGLGRFVWGSASDKLGRINTFRILLIVEALVFAGLIFTKNPMIFSVGVCIVLLNYGGAFGVIPSLVKESYGAKLMATMYGVALTAWGVGGILGLKLQRI
jgi:OFA family oxalate/formate antiporter-like MFS transporter